MITKKVSSILNRGAIWLSIIAGFPAVVLGDAYDVFYTPTSSQESFAAGDVKTALESKGHTATLKPLASLSAGNSNPKVVIALASNAAVKTILTNEGGSSLPTLGEQAYAIRTTTNPKKSYWVFGGDVNGAMYGGLQIAENITFDNLTGSYNTEEKPTILKRGIKLNIQLDARTDCYGNDSTSKSISAKNAWDIKYWQTWFDEMARNRYNLFSMWTNDPFTSMINMEGTPWPKSHIEGFVDPLDKSKTVQPKSIEEKIAHWRAVMAYAKNRGFQFYLFNWNLWIDGNSGLKDYKEGVKDPNAVKYIRTCTKRIFETYEDLRGFGITQGEHMGDDDIANVKFLFNGYGEGVKDFASSNPNRKIEFIFRVFLLEYEEIIANFKSLDSLPNIEFNVSYKYAIAHMYGAEEPLYVDFKEQDAIADSISPARFSYLTIRNDDFYFQDWCDPVFAKNYIKKLPGQGQRGKRPWLRGFYMGSDGFSPTRTFFHKDPSLNNKGTLEVQRQWAHYKIWGRMSYNPDTDPRLFSNHMARKFPTLSSSQVNSLFEAWNKVSRAMPKAGEIMSGSNKGDDDWYPELCQTKTEESPFITAAVFAKSETAKGAAILSIAETVQKKLTASTPGSSFHTADLMEGYANEALAGIAGLSGPAGSELERMINNVRSLSYLTTYYAHKIRGATYLLMKNKPAQADSLGKAYCSWRQYSTLMDSMYIGIDMSRSTDFKNWFVHDAAVLKEYQTAGTGIPNCASNPNRSPAVSITAPANDASFTAPANVTVTANASDSDGTVSKVEFFNGATLVSTDTTAPYSAILSGLTAGTYTVQAKAYDDKNATSTSSIQITVTSIGLPSVTVAATTQASEPTGNGVFTFSRTGITTAALTVNYAVSGTATSGTDYQSLGTSVTFAAGQANATKSVAVQNDSLVEGNETVIVNLSSGAGYTVGSSNSASVTITDDDSEPGIAVSVVATTQASEPSGNGVFTFSRTGRTSAALTVNYTVGGTATSGTDYQSLGTTVTFAAGQAIATKNVTVQDDLIVENNETVNVTLTNGAGYTLTTPNSATVTITDNDRDLPVTTVTVAATTANAAEPATNGLFTFTRSGSIISALTANFNVSGTATSGADYTNLGTTVSFAAGQASVTRSVSVLDDNITESTETVIVTLVNGAGYVAGTPSSATVSIADKPPLNGLPYAVNFNGLPTGTTSQGAPTAWTATRTGSSPLRVVANRLEINGAGGEGVFSTGVINIAGSAANLSLNVEGAGGLDAGDYIRLFIRVDGTEKLVREVKGKQSAASWTQAAITGSTLQVIIRTSVSASDEFYRLDNLSITTAGGGGGGGGGGGLPSPWQTLDVGAVGAAGSVSFNSNLWTIKGSGADVIGLVDEFRYVHQPASGDCNITVRVASLQNTHPWAKVGLMIRQSTDANSPNVFVFVTPSNGVTLTSRSTIGGSTDNSTPGVAGQTAPKWLRLTRTGNSFKAERSDTGNPPWTQIGSTRIVNMAAEVTIGLAYTSHADGTVGTSTMDNVITNP